jgi:hypothetical protein
MSSLLEEYALVFGFGGVPQSPKKKRWYVCNLSFEHHMKNPVLQCKETPESKINLIVDHYASVPEYVPRFLDSYIVRHNLNTHFPIEILEPSKSPGTWCLGRQTPDEQRPGSPSVRQDPSATYKDERTQPKNPSQ